MNKLCVYVTRVIPQEGLRLVREACDAKVWEGKRLPRARYFWKSVRGMKGCSPC